MSTRVRHVFDIPASMHGDTDLRELEIVELTANDEIMAAKRSGQEQAKMMMELAKASVYAINGKPINNNEGAVDTWFDSLSPAVRSLVVSAYHDVHNVKADDAQAFIKSRRVRV